jgi:hypothetical protein
MSSALKGLKINSLWNSNFNQREIFIKTPFIFKIWREILKFRKNSIFFYRNLSNSLLSVKLGHKAIFFSLLAVYASKLSLKLF